MLKNLCGDWLMVWGALHHVLLVSDRVTLYIDLVPLSEITNKDQLKIMKIAGDNSFLPETINFSAEYSVKKQKNWRELMILFENKKFTSLSSI